MVGRGVMMVLTVMEVVVEMVMAEARRMAEERRAVEAVVAEQVQRARCAWVGLEPGVEGVSGCGGAFDQARVWWVEESGSRCDCTGKT